MEIWPCNYQTDTDEKNDNATDDGETYEALEISDAVDDEWPDQIELLLDLKRPEVGNVEMR